MTYKSRTTKTGVTVFDLSGELEHRFPLADTKGKPNPGQIAWQHEKDCTALVIQNAGYSGDFFVYHDGKFNVYVMSKIGAIVTF